ncbi:MAG: hypothetical protein ACI8Z5_002579, partial [Lentimonas sp.]
RPAHQRALKISNFANLQISVGYQLDKDQLQIVINTWLELDETGERVASFC